MKVLIRVAYINDVLRAMLRVSLTDYILVHRFRTSAVRHLAFTNSRLKKGTVVELHISLERRGG